jgi:hypothetical protein
MWAGRLLPFTYVEGCAIKALMAKRMRLIIDTDQEVQLAVTMAANKAEIGKSEFVNAILRKVLAKEIELSKKYLMSRGGKEQAE